MTKASNDQITEDGSPDSIYQPPGAATTSEGGQMDIIKSQTRSLGNRQFSTFGGVVRLRNWYPRRVEYER